jgi:hypothetical protein
VAHTSLVICRWATTAQSVIAVTKT